MKRCRKSWAQTGVALAAVALVATAWLSYAAAAQEKDYVGQTQCKVCHNKKAEGEQWAKWQASKHAKAFELLKSDEAKKVAADKGVSGAPHEAPECLKCHVTGYDAEAKKFHEKLKPEDGIQCESCHGPASEHLKDGKTLTFKKEEAANIDIYKNIVKGDEAACKKCHNDTSPTWKADRYTLEDGAKVGFDFKQASEKIAHPNPTKKKE